MTADEKRLALLNAEPRKPIKKELGGGYYYECYWITCRQTVTKWFNYCPYCGQKIDWEGVIDE